MMSDLNDLLTSGKRPLIIAHRGASFYHHENTMEAFEAAVDMGAEMVEMDVHRTKDAVLVIHHDQDLDGTKIKEMTVDQIRERSESKGYIIPTLSEVLQSCKDRISVDIELKEAGYEEQVLGTVLDIVGPDQFLLSSGCDMAVHRIKALRPEIKTGLVLYRASFPGLLRHLFPRARVEHTGVDILMMSERLLNMGFLRFNKGLEKPVWVYTVNDRKRLWELITDGRIEALFTDRPDIGLFLRDLHAVQSGQLAPEKTSV